MMTTNLFVIVNVKQLRTYVVLEFYCLFSEHLGVGVLNSAICLTVFTIRLSLARLLEGLRNFGWGGFQHPNPPSVRHWWPVQLCLSTLSHKRYGIWAKVLKIKCVFWFSLQLLSEIFLTLRRIQRVISINVQRDSKRWTQFRTSIFPELYTVCEWST